MKICLYLCDAWYKIKENSEKYTTPSLLSMLVISFFFPHKIYFSISKIFHTEFFILRQKEENKKKTVNRSLLRNIKMGGVESTEKGIK
jgi:hypothetical protein